MRVSTRQYGRHHCLLYSLNSEDYIPHNAPRAGPGRAGEGSPLARFGRGPEVPAPWRRERDAARTDGTDAMAETDPKTVQDLTAVVRHLPGAAAVGVASGARAARDDR